MQSKKHHWAETPSPAYAFQKEQETKNQEGHLLRLYFSASHGEGFYAITITLLKKPLGHTRRAIQLAFPSPVPISCLNWPNDLLRLFLPFFSQFWNRLYLSTNAQSSQLIKRNVRGPLTGSPESPLW